jgi:hypothetical protein
MIDGDLYHFESRGLYDGVSILWDEETGSLWHHVTGRAMNGPMAGAEMQTFNALQMTAGAALKAYPDLRVAISDRPIRRGNQRSVDRDRELSERFRETMADEDTRRPTMEIGIGIWDETEGSHRYYAVEAIRESGNALIDDLEAGRVLIHLDPLTGTPLAQYTSASSAEWDGDTLRLDTGSVIRDGLLYTPGGERQEVRRPLQLFTRWYGWALMFPDTEIWVP